MQRMQLQMTAPLDIGLEQNDASLSMGQDDLFDLVDTQRELRKKSGISELASDDEMPSDEAVEEVNDSDKEIIGFEDEEEERDRRVLALEADLDSMYDAYREKMKERDAKYRVAEARKAKSQLDEWSGLQGENDAESDDDGSEAGGWEEMAAAKEIGGSSSDESDYNKPIPGRKRTRPNPVLEKHVDIPPPSRAAQVWFSQDIFREVAEPDEEGEDDDVEMISSTSERQQDDQGDKVCNHLSSISFLTTTSPRPVISRLFPPNLGMALACGTLRTKMWIERNKHTSRVRIQTLRLDQG